jgi:NhaP-type Na+/H+ or K+/H+ antiporter
VLFGAVLLGPALAHMSARMLIYALLSLTVVRMVPVAIAMLGSHARAPTVGFLGWFGPRGLASIVFAVTVIQESQLPHEQLLASTVYVAVGISVVAHGTSAAPLAARYGRWYGRHPGGKRPEMESVPTRLTRPRHHLGSAVQPATQGR